MFEENDVKCDMQTITFKGKGARTLNGAVRREKTLMGSENEKNALTKDNLST